MSDDNKNVQKTVGYLEKRGKLKLISSWKKYWFVLEGQLLLYYGSKDEYDALSPCKGSITLGPKCNVKPYSSAPIGFQIETRSTTVTLRADCVNEQTKWMQAILSSLNQQSKNVSESPTKLNHFRYSTERVNMLLNNADSSKDVNSPKSTAGKKLERTESTLLDRLQKLGAKSYNDAILETINTKSVKLRETPSPKKLQFSPKFKVNSVENVVIKDDDFCVCEFAKKNDENKVKVEELNNNWKLQTKTEEQPHKLTRQISLLGEYYSDNELYAEPPNVFCENDLYAASKLSERIEELQCSMEFIEEPNEFECENEVYCAPETLKNDAFEYCDNEIYAIPDRTTSQFECENELYAEVKKENSSSVIVDENSGDLYAEPNDEGSTIEIDENSGHLYSVPFQQDDSNLYENPETFRSDEKSKKMKKKREECKKNDGFIQRLLKHSWKPDKNEDLLPEETDVDKTLVMLSNLQDMLEKKKTLIKSMAKEKRTTTSSSSEIDKDNPRLGRHKSPDLLRDLNLEEDYCEVYDGLQNKDEDIYSEVVENERRSKEFKDTRKFSMEGRASGSREPPKVQD